MAPSFKTCVRVIFMRDNMIIGVITKDVSDLYKQRDDAHFNGQNSSIETQ